MNSISVYIELGWKHLTDLGGYDHMLFLLALVAGYSIKDWKKLTWLVTAFTVGHSAALALAVFNLIQVNATLVEYAIIISIGVLAVLKLINISISKKLVKRTKRWYLLVLFFGIIHGLGFSNYLKQIIGSQDLWVAILGFNIGLELAQITFVCLALGLLTLLNKFINTKKITIGVTALVTIWSMFLLINY